MSVEFRIRKLLNEKRKTEQIVEELLNLAASPDCSNKEISEITQFLIQMGMYKDAFRQYPRRFYEQKLITWPHFIEILRLHEIKPDKEILEAIFIGAQKLKKESALVLQRGWDPFEVRFKEIRRALWQEKVEELDKKKHSLLQKLEFLRNQRMMGEEKKVFKKFLEMFPDDAGIGPLYEEFKERWALELVESRKEKTVVQESVTEEYELPFLTAEELEIAEVIYKAVEEYVDQNSHPKNRHALDFALMFLNFDLPEFAARLAQRAQASPAKNWFYADLLFEKKSYQDCLLQLELIDNEYSADPETKFGTSYLRAKILSAMGQKQKAIELLNNIVQLRPNYRSCSTLLAELIEDRR